MSTQCHIHDLDYCTIAPPSSPSTWNWRPSTSLSVLDDGKINHLCFYKANNRRPGHFQSHTAHVSNNKNKTTKISKVIGSTERGSFTGFQGSPQAQAISMLGTAGGGEGVRRPPVFRSCRRLCNHTRGLHLSLNVAQTSPFSNLSVTKATTCMLELVPSVPAMYIHTAVGSAIF